MAEKAGFEIHADLKALRKEFNQAKADFRTFNQDAIKAASGVRTLENAADSASKKIGFFNTTFGKTLTAFTGGFLGAGLVTRVVGFFQDWGRAIISASSNFQELDSKARIVFGETFPMVEARVQSIAAEVGRADSAIMQFSADLGAVIDAAGLTKEATAGMSTEFAKLAIDLASFHNTTDVEAFNALRSAITGELEPLKRFGVVMTQANLQAFALSKGIKQKVETMTQAQLTALRYNYILDRTTTAQGDAARTADSYANQSRRLSGELTELNEQLGRSATPVLASGLSVLNNAIQNVRIFVSLLMQDLKSLFSMLNVNIGGTSVATTLKEAAITTISALNPVAGAWLKSRKMPGQGAIQSRINEQKAMEATESGPMALPTLDEMMKQYAGGGAKAGGGGAAKKEAEELLKAEGDVLKALGDQAKANLDNLRLRREELLVRQKLGVLTRAEERELQQINRRLEFSDEALDGLVKKWEEQQDAIREASDRLADYRKELKEAADDLKDALSDIDKNASEKRVEKIRELVKEQNEILALRGGSTDLTGDQSYRLSQIADELSAAKQGELDEGTKRAGMTDLQLEDADAAKKKQELIDEEKTKREELLRKIDDERRNIEQLKIEATNAEQAIVDALNNRLTQTTATYKLIQDATKAHVSEMISELSKLQKKYGEVGMSPMTIPDPSASSGGSVTNNSTQTINVNQVNNGDAARTASDARGIRWTLRKNS